MQVSKRRIRFLYKVQSQLHECDGCEKGTTVEQYWLHCRFSFSFAVMEDLLQALETCELSEDDLLDAREEMLSRFFALNPEKDYLLAALVLRGICLTTRGSSNMCLQDFIRLIEEDIGAGWCRQGLEELSFKLRTALRFLASHVRTELPSACFEGSETCLRCRMNDRKCRHYLQYEEEKDGCEMQQLELEPPFHSENVNVTIGLDKKRQSLQSIREEYERLCSKEKEILQNLHYLTKPRYLGLGTFAETAALGLHLHQRSLTLDEFRTSAAAAITANHVEPLRRALCQVHLTQRDMKAALEDVALVTMDPCTCFSQDTKFLRESVVFKNARLAAGVQPEELLKDRRFIIGLDDVQSILNLPDRLVSSVLTVFVFNRWLNIQDVNIALKWHRPEERPLEDINCIVPLYDEGLFGIVWEEGKLIGQDILRLLTKFLTVCCRHGTNSRSIISVIQEANS